MGASQSTPETSIHEFTVKDSGGKDVNLGTYKGKVLLVVNVASKCGFTEKNYTQLTELYQKYKELAFTTGKEHGNDGDGEALVDTLGYALRQLLKFCQFNILPGFEVLAFPCNQFLRQEPGNDHEIKEFACTRFKAEYPVFQKVHVNGQDAAPVYKFLKASKPGLFGTRIKWNFTKFLVDKNGEVIDRYSTTTSPLAIEDDIQKAL